VSAGELARALAAGIAAGDVVFSGVGKSAADIRTALAAGIAQINAESAAEVAQISAVAAAMGVVAPVALRVNVDVDAGTHAKISTGQRDTKFGISTDQREASTLYAQLAADPHIKPMGLAVHIGSQICDLAPFERAYTALLDVANGLRAMGLQVPCLDLGGGVGVDYQQAGDTDFSTYGALVTRLFKDSGFHLGFEPGRAITANNGALLTEVIYVKPGDNKRFVIVDAAMNDLLRPTLYEAHHPIVTLAPPQPTIGKADIVGPVCETGDYLGLDRDMPDLRSGDRLAVLSAGAYGAVMASAYNTRPPAAELLVLDGTAHLLRPARSIDSLLAEESIPAFC
jgi:diaminopimelate decarboxylase